ncbi:MAG TPA: hypothetical protein VD788_02310 [Candidatus Polarisedimenticolaceae bacterium]|nr:hypothetical protein [Candidatus Polarisedimenticolaceae bacterium]
MTQPIRYSRVAGACLLLALAVGPISAGVAVEIDSATLNEILGAVSVNRVEVALTENNTVVVELHDLHVIGLVPSTRDGQRHAILTSVLVVAPELGLKLPLEPRVALDVVQLDGASMLELRFEDLGLRVPLMGQVNLAAMLPPMRYPATNVWMLDGARGGVPVASRLSSIEMDQRRVRFLLDVEVVATPEE